jgi:hypothetical protein
MPPYPHHYGEPEQLLPDHNLVQRSQLLVEIQLPLQDEQCKVQSEESALLASE